MQNSNVHDNLSFLYFLYDGYCVCVIGIKIWIYATTVMAVSRSICLNQDVFSRIINLIEYLIRIAMEVTYTT